MEILYKLINTKTNETFPLKYKIFDTPIAKKWLELMRNALDQDYSVQNDGEFFGTIYDSYEDLKNKIQQCIDVINHHCEKQNLSKILIHTDDEGLSRKFLNELHYQFELLEPLEVYRKDENVLEHLLNMNLYIHRAEEFLDEKNFGGCHIEINIRPFQVHDLADEDYDYFSSDLLWGNLYITYGMTGVPTLQGYYAKAEPTPQCVYSAGNLLWFKQDSIISNDERSNIEKWYQEEYNLDINDKKSALGYIPVGEVINPFQTKEELIEKLTNFKAVKTVTLLDGNMELNKNIDEEIKYHLDQNPLLIIDNLDNMVSVHNEIKYALNYFEAKEDIVNQNFKNPFRRILPIKKDNSDTVFSKLTPSLSSFVQEFSAYNECENVSVETIFPGATVNFGAKKLAGKIEYYALLSTGADIEAIINGSKQEVASGSLFMTNTAGDLKLRNNTSDDIFLISFDGPLQISNSELIKTARTQNGVAQRKQLIHHVWREKLINGEEVNDELMNEFMTSGLNFEIMGDDVSLLLVEHEYQNDEIKEECLENITKASLFPLRYDVIDNANLQTSMAKAYEEGKKVAIVIASGTLVTHINDFIRYSLEFSYRMIGEQKLCAGHIMDFGEDKLPYFHEQFAIINLELWHRLGQVPLGPLFTPDIVEFPNYISSEEKFHDHYTPFWLKRGKGEKIKGEVSWGTLLMAKSLEHNIDVLNIDEPLRNVRTYAYPLDGASYQYKGVKSLINHFLQIGQNEVYYFNNEPLKIIQLDKFEPDNFISVSAGFKPMSILNQYWKGREPKSIKFCDYSNNALNYLKGMGEANTVEEIKEYIFEYQKKDEYKSYRQEDITSYVDGILVEAFDTESQDLIEATKKLSKAEFGLGNFVADPESITEHFNKGESFLFWMSNAFYSNYAYYCISKDQAEKNLLNMAIAIQKKTGNKKLYKHTFSYNFLFGNSLTEVKGLLTDGCLYDVEIFEHEWQEISPDGKIIEKASPVHASPQ